MTRLTTFCISLIIISLMLVFVVPMSTAQNGSVLSLAERGDYVEVPNSDILQPTQQVTVEAWIQKTQIGQHGRIAATDWGKGYALGNTGAGGVKLHINRETAVSSNTVPLGEWHHVAGVYDGSQIKVFIDGVEDGIEMYDQPIGTNFEPLKFGVSIYFEQFYGLIDELRIWNIARTQAEIQATMNSLLNGGEPGLVGYWRFDELENLGIGGDGLADDVRDLSGNGNHGDLVGNANLVPASFAAFSDVASGTVLADTGDARGIAWGDYDNDGDLDLYLANRYQANKLFKNNQGTFTDVASTAGVDDRGQGHGVAWGDYDNDGDLDLYLANWGGQANKLFKNNGGTFTDVASTAGVDDTGNGNGVAWGDYDNDGDLDLYLANSGQANKLFKNNGGTFTDVTLTAGVDDTGNGNGVAWGDYDNDGDLDLYLTNWGHANKLFKNNGGTFMDVASTAGVDDTGQGQGAAWGDYDNDGDLDLYLVNKYQANKLFKNNEGTFTDVTSTAGVDDTGNGVGVAWGDYDNDGDLDLYLANANQANKLFQNNQDDSNFLFVRPLDGNGRFNRHGTVVRVYQAGTTTLVGMRTIDGGSSLCSQNEYDAHFGLPATGTYDIEVTFPGGTVVDKNTNPLLGNISPMNIPQGYVEVQQVGGASLPVILSISPNWGYIIGGTEVTIAVKDVQDGATVTIGGTPAVDVTNPIETEASIESAPINITDEAPVNTELSTTLETSPPVTKTITFSTSQLNVAVLEPLIQTAIDNAFGQGKINVTISGSDTAAVITFKTTATGYDVSLTIEQLAGSDALFSEPITNTGGLVIHATTPDGNIGPADVVVANPDGAEAILHNGFVYIPLTGDVSGDGTVSAYDAALILRYVVGLIDEFPADSMFSPSAIEAHDYELSLPNIETPAGGKIQVPIAINDAKGLLAGGITVKYDSTVLRAIDYASLKLLNGYYWKANTNLPGEIRFAFASVESTKGQGNLLMVEFEILPNTEGRTSPLILENVNLSNSRSITKINGEVRIIPSTFALLQNFPNPFNPETWLPYKLASASPVTISIYNAKGQLIRTISLGNQNAGVYVARDRAAYWNGRDSLGEKVASGVYYYQLEAGEFRATRKMVIVK